MYRFKETRLCNVQIRCMLCEVCSVFTVPYEYYSRSDREDYVRHTEVIDHSLKNKFY